MTMIMRRRGGVFAGSLVVGGLLAFGLFPSAAVAQAADGGSARKTIEISASEKVQVVAEIATVKIGCQNQAPTKDAAYAENTRVANKIVKALVDAGVPKEAIQTESLSLAKDEDRYGNKPQGPMPYSANQQLLIHAKASDAEKVVDIAIAAGANRLQDVEWSVAEPKELETKAYAAALMRAKALAEQTATQAGLKLGEIVSIVNSADAGGRFGPGYGRGRLAVMAMLQVSAAKMPMLALHPAIVEREASVTVTYAIAP
jgi:uncharacterized protein YggE